MKYSISKATKFFPETNLFENSSFEINTNDKIAVVGKNGSGKTTLLKIIYGIEELESGEIHKSNGIKIGYLAQTTFDNENLTFRQSIESEFKYYYNLEKQLEDITWEMNTNHSQDILDKYAAISNEYETNGGYTYQMEMEQIFTKFGFIIDDIDKKISEFSGGQKTRLAFVKLLVSKPDILLLDEPTNHLDIETISWLEGYIKNYPKAVVVVSHDRYFMDKVVNRVFDISNNKINHYTGNYSSYIKQREIEYERNKKLYSNQQKEIERLNNLIEKFRYKSTKAAFAQSKIKYLDRLEKIDNPVIDERTFNAVFTPKSRGANKVLEISELSIGYENELALINLIVNKGDRIGVIGGNGQGKSTFLKTLVNRVNALNGDFRFGHQVEIGYFDQEFANFNDQNTLIEEIWESYPNLNQTEVRSALGRFMFSNDDVFKQIYNLSGGEKVRLSLVKLMLKQANCLILDEPTNHLDIVGKEALEKALQSYEGTIIFVSHDRYFINELANRIVVLDNGFNVYDLTYDEYINKDKEITNTKEVKEIKTKTVVKNINYSHEIKKLEKLIGIKEEEIESLRELRFEPEYYHDNKKMLQLDNDIDQVNNELTNALSLWEEYSEALENINDY